MLGRGVSQRPTQCKNALAEVAFLDHRRWPDGFQQPGLVQHLARVGDHVEQHVERSRGHLDDAIRAAELSLRSIEVKAPEFEDSRLGGVVHIRE